MPAAYASSAAAAVANLIANVTVTKPSGVAAGDLLIAFAWANNGTATWTPPVTPAWQTVTTQSNIGCAMFSRVADGSEGADFLFVRSNTSGTAGVIMVRVTGAGTVQAASLTSVSSSATIALQAVTAALADTLLVQMPTSLNNTGDSWTPPGTATERVDTTASGNAIPYAIGDEVVGSGSTGTRTWTRTLTQNNRGGMVAINPPLTPADSAHSHASESPALTQVHETAPADSAHAHASESPSLTQVHELAPADSAHGHTTEAPSLTQVHALTAADSDHAHASESPALTQTHEVAPADSVHEHSAESPTLTVVVHLEPADSIHAHASESPALTLVHLLAPADSAHAHASDLAALTQVHALIALDSLHAHTSESPVLSRNLPTPAERTSTADAVSRVSTATESRTSTATATSRTSSN